MERKHVRDQAPRAAPIQTPEELPNRPPITAAVTRSEPVIGDWVETARGEVGLITDLCSSVLGTVAEVCVGRCYREVPIRDIRRKLDELSASTE